MKTGNWTHLVAFCRFLPRAMRYIFFQTPGSQPPSTWMQMRWAKFTSMPLGLKDGWQRWDSYEHAPQSMLVVTFVTALVISDTEGGWHALDFTKLQPHLTLRWTSLHNCKHADKQRLYSKFSCHWSQASHSVLWAHYFLNKVFWFSVFLQRHFGISCSPSQVFFPCFWSFDKWQKSICVGQHRGTLYYCSTSSILRRNRLFREAARYNGWQLCFDAPRRH